MNTAECQRAVVVIEPAGLALFRATQRPRKIRRQPRTCRSRGTGPMFWYHGPTGVRQWAEAVGDTGRTVGHARPPWRRSQDFRTFCWPSLLSNRYDAS